MPPVLVWPAQAPIGGQNLIGDYGIGLPSWQVLRWVLIAVAGWAAILLAAYITENYDVSLNPPTLSYNPTATRMIPLAATAVRGDGLFVDGKQVAKRGPSGEWVPIDRTIHIEGTHIFYRGSR